MPLNPETRRALEKLNRGPLKHPSKEEAPVTEGPACSPGTDTGPDAARGHRRAPMPPSPPRRAPSTGEELALPLPPPEAPPSLEHLVPGAVVETASGGYYLHERGVDLPFDEDRALSRVLSQVLAPEAPGDAGALFLDIETVGLSNRPLFLVGVLTLQSDGLWLRQLLARDYSEERAVLEATQDLLRHHPHLVTFNGKTFDVPYIANRCLHHQLPPPEPRSHLDLLFAARRFWRRFIPNCRLQTIERHLCCRERVDDIPGAQMGQVYRDFIRTGDATRIRGALHHNLLDLIAMAEMVCLLGEAGTLPARSRQEILPYRGT